MVSITPNIAEIVVARTYYIVVARVVVIYMGQLSQLPKRSRVEKIDWINRRIVRALCC